MIFKQIDTDNDGIIQRSELLAAMQNMGYRSLSEDDITKMISEVDLNDDKQIQYSEYLQMMKSFEKSGKETQFSKVVTKDGKNFMRVGTDSAYSSFNEDEKIAFVKVINTVLADDEDCKKYLPIDPESMDLFNLLKNGVILCKLVNKAQQGSIDERAVNKKDNMNIYQQTENVKLALTASKAIGIKIVGIFPDSILDGNVIVMGLIWQVLRLIVTKEINLKKIPQLIRLLQDGEEINDLLKMNPEDLLVRWFNFHLANAGYSGKITNFSTDIKDSEKYVYLFNQLSPQQCDKSALGESDLTKRAAMVIENSKKLGVESYITAKDISSGKLRVNTLFVASIFNHCHGLDPPTEEEQYEAAKLLEDGEGSRDERTFRHWMNSIGIEGVQVNNLYEDCRSGVIILKVLDKLKPGSVNWKKVTENTTSKFKKLDNCNETIEASKKAGFTIVSLHGMSILDGHRQSILAIVWQLMRCHTLQLIKGKTEEDLIKWGNELAGEKYKITNFKNPQLKTSLYFIHIMNAIEPRAINWDLINQG
jgi:plastin-1